MMMAPRERRQLVSANNRAHLEAQDETHAVAQCSVCAAGRAPQKRLVSPLLAIEVTFEEMKIKDLLCTMDTPILLCKVS